MPEETLPNYDPTTSEPETFGSMNDAMQHFAKRVRAFMQDETEVNKLMGEREFSWESIYRAVEAAVSDWNLTPPIGSVKLDAIKVVIRPLFYMKAAAWLLRVAANPQARNQLSYSDQGWTVQEYDKAPMYLQMAGNLEGIYEEKKVKYKAAMNAESMWGGLHSDYIKTGSGESGFETYF